VTQHSVFQLNGYQVTAEVEGDEVLLDTVRRLGAKSVRGACGIGVCGTCTVLVDGKPVSSCLKLTASIDGRSVITSEGWSPMRAWTPSSAPSSSAAPTSARSAFRPWS